MLFLTYDPQLNPTELEIYKYISHNIEKVPYMTIRELADEIHFSKTAIWRFCQKFECEGYTDFKFKLKNYLSERKKTAQPKSLDETMLIHFTTLIRRIIRRTDCSSCGIAGKKRICSFYWRRNVQSPS